MPTPVESYALLTDLKGVGFVTTFFSGDQSFTDDQLQQFLNEGASYIDSIIVVNPRLTLPLATPYDPMLIRSNLDITVWNMLIVRGYNPEEPSDASIKARYDLTVKWLDKIANGRAKLTRQATSVRAEGVQPRLIQNRSRGLRNWGGMIGGNGQ